jgi:hypothetical protein
MGVIRLKDNWRRLDIEVVVQHGDDPNQSTQIMFFRGNSVLFSLDPAQTAKLVIEIIKQWKGKRPEGLPLPDSIKVA